MSQFSVLTKQFLSTQLLKTMCAPHNKDMTAAVARAGWNKLRKVVLTDINDCLDENDRAAKALYRNMRFSHIKSRQRFTFTSDFFTHGFLVGLM